MSNTVREIKDRQPNQATIKMQEGLLAEAKSGGLRSVVVLSGFDNDGWNHSWSLDYRNTRRRMLGELSMLQYDMLTNVAFEDGDAIISQAFED